ncbi:hypothetical protein ACP70R_008871 [Stipagrostis hirtigluma subsp. patula]
MSPPAGVHSRSVVVGAAATGRHLLDIEGYSHTKVLLPIGHSVELPPFSVGERSWVLNYYPNGCNGLCDDFISISITHQPDDYTVESYEVGVRVTLSLLDQAGEPVLSQTQARVLYVDSYDEDAHGNGITFNRFIERAWLEESEHLRDDCFTISCDVAVPLEVRTEEKLGAEAPPAAAPLVVVPPSDLHRHLAGLLVTEEGADVTFRVAGETFRAHRCVLAARSTVFRAELFGPMKEEESDDATGANGDAAVPIIRVDDMEAQVFRALLAFVYTDALPPDAPNTKRQEEAAMLQRLLVAADRYKLERLKLICEDKLCRHIDTGSAATILALAEQRSCRGLKKACLQFLGDPSNMNDVLARLRAFS